jgi:hypothetical protein
LLKGFNIKTSVYYLQIRGNHAPFYTALSDRLKCTASDKQDILDSWKQNIELRVV